jgi:hypothetical protein
MSNGAVSRFFGGSPAWVLVRLVLLSILVGVIMAALGIDPWNIVDSLLRIIDWFWYNIWDAIGSIWRYFLLGAVIVIPIWLIARLAKGGRP